MKNILIIFTLFFSCSAMAEFDYSAYKTGSLKGAINSLDKEMIELDYYFDAAPSKLKVVVLFTGKHRNITEPVQSFISKWVKALGHPPEYEKLFPFEVEVEENGIKYWLPIQGALVEPFAAEVMPNNAVELYIMFMGGYKHHPIFSINEFMAK